jgi:hypothetical protein
VDPPPPRPGQHPLRRIDAPARTADRRGQGEEVIAGAAADLKHARVPLQNSLQGLQHAGMDLAVARVLCGQLVIVECCCFHLDPHNTLVSDVGRLSM